LIGPAQSRWSQILVIGIAVAVTSIPVISRIFYDLKILHTRFAKLVLGVAVIEDTILWAVLAIATALAKSVALPTGAIAQEIVLTVIYFTAGLTLAPRLLRRLHHSGWNLIANASPVAYLFVILFAYIALAAILNVNLVFAAFLAGLATPRREDAHRGEHDYADALRSISSFAFAFFIPVYFALVGFKLDLGQSFSLPMLAVFLSLACAVKLLSVLAGARLAGFKGLDAVNLAVATNARGGPGIVLASVAFETQIISASFYTTLILTAILTSQAAGVWLEQVLRRGKPLLSGEKAPVVPPEVETEQPLAA
jgi:Kef-type K+ transport system membrane component KefB